jgi:hypothetical protein
MAISAMVFLLTLSFTYSMIVHAVSFGYLRLDSPFFIQYELLLIEFLLPLLFDSDLKYFSEFYGVVCLSA